MNRKGPKKMKKLMNSSIGSCTNTSPSCGSSPAGNSWRSAGRGLKNGAETPENANSAWHAPRIASTITIRIGRRRNFVRQYQ